MGVVLRVALLVLGGAALALILQLDRFGKRSLLIILLTRLLLSLIDRRVAAATAVLGRLALIILVFDLFVLAYQLFICLRSSFAPVVFVARIRQALGEFGQVLREYDCLQQFAVRLALVFVHGGRALHVLLLFGLDDRRLEQFVRIWPLLRIHVEHLLDDGPELNRIILWNPLYLSSAHSFEQALHARRLERRLQRDHLVEDAAE